MFLSPFIYIGTDYDLEIIVTSAPSSAKYNPQNTLGANPWNYITLRFFIMIYYILYMLN